eukprot:1335898-Pyramimonas_sp.AAC.1
MVRIGGPSDRPALPNRPLIVAVNPTTLNRTAGAPQAPLPDVQKVLHPVKFHQSRGLARK